MCGIAGIYLKCEKANYNEHKLKIAAEALKHRGPDGYNIFTNDLVGLAHTRLSIIDIEGGDQPLWDDEKKTCLIANGEIYNYKELKNHFLNEGAIFKTKSDCEPMIHAYKSYGLDFIKHLQGMFAIALWDSEEEKIILARDPFGIKPLYICQNQNGIAFASEPQALVEMKWVEPAFNHSAAPAYFHTNCTLGKETFFAKIERVLPGEVIVIKHGDIVERHMYPLILIEPIANQYNEKQALATLEQKLHQSVQYHLQSDVPFGLFLSGGTDSSATAVKMQEIDKNIKTYSIGFDDNSVANELLASNLVARALKTNHTEVIFNESDFWDYLPKMCKSMDDLSADYACLPLLKLAEKASKDVKIILTGEGGDEFFAGYSNHRLRWWKDALYKLSGNKSRLEHHYYDLFSDDILNFKLPQPVFPTKFTPVQKRQWWNITYWLPDGLLIKLDRCLMAYGIEGRVPLIDKKLSMFAFSLPDELKIKGKNGKWLLKYWLNEKLPILDVFSPKKGFTVPVGSWLSNRQKNLYLYLNNHPALQGIIQQKGLKKLLTENTLNQRDGIMAFKLLCLCVWFDIHIKQKRLPDSLFCGLDKEKRNN